MVDRPFKPVKVKGTPLSRTIIRDRQERHDRLAGVREKKMVFVEIVGYEGKVVVSCMGPMGCARADRVEDGANINLNHDDYFTRQVEAEKHGPTKCRARK